MYVRILQSNFVEKNISSRQYDEETKSTRTINFLKG